MRLVLFDAYCLGGGTSCPFAVYKSLYVMVGEPQSLDHQLILAGLDHRGLYKKLRFEFQYEELGINYPIENMLIYQIFCPFPSCNHFPGQPNPTRSLLATDIKKIRRLDFFFGSK